MTSKREFKRKRQDLITAATGKTAGGRILISYVPGLGNLGVEDYMTTHSDCVSSAETIFCTEAVQAFFALVNVSKRDWLSWYKAEKDVQLDEPRNDDFYEIPRAKSWKDGNWPVTFPDEPCIPPAALWGALETIPILSPAEICTVLDNATYGGVPCLTISVSEDVLKRHDFSKPAIIEPVTWKDGGKERVTAGFIGIHDFVNGSGYIEQSTKSITIPAGIDDWIAPESVGYGLDQVHGIVGSFYVAKLSNLDMAKAAA